MKLFATSGYVFNPTAVPPTIDLSALSGITEAGILAIIDTTTDLTLYKAGTPGFGIRAWSNNVLTFQASTPGCAASDALLVIYDDGKAGASDATARAILGALQGTLTVGGTVAVTGGAQDATLQSILAALKAQTNLSDTLFVDPTTTPPTFYVRREQVNEGTGAITIAFENVAGGTASPTVANLVPASGSSRVVETAFFDIVTAGTGTNAGDVVARALVYDTVSGALVTAIWQNLTQGATIQAPAAGTYVEQTKQTVVTSMPGAAATGAALEAGGNLAALTSAFGTATTAAPANDTASSPFMGLVRRALGYLGTLAGAVANSRFQTAPQANAPSVSTAGTMSAVGSNVTLAIDGMSACAIQIAGSWTGALTFQGSPDGGTTYYPVSAIPYSGGASIGTASANGLWECAIGGLTHLQVVAATALTSGSATVLLRATTGLKSLRVGTASGNPISVINTAVTLTDRSSSTSSTVNTVTSPFGVNTARQFARIVNLTSGTSTGTIYVYDKAGGTPTTANSIPIVPGASWQAQYPAPSNAISVFSPTASVLFEAAEG